MQVLKKFCVVLIMVLCIAYSVMSATVGYTTLYSSTSTNTNRRALPVTMPANGIIDSIVMYHDASTSGYQLQFGIYSDASNAPGSKLASTEKTNVSTTLRILSEVRKGMY